MTQTSATAGTPRDTRILAQLAQALERAAHAENAEQSLLQINQMLAENLGSPDAHKAPNALKEGEIQQFACGAFFLTPDASENVLIAPFNYHPDQAHMRIDATLGHPGWVVANDKSLLLPNTDLEPSFVKILQTFRAGSAIYAPIRWNGKFLGQIICAAQARNTMSETDLAILEVCAHVAGLIWTSRDGDAYLKALLNK